MSALVLFVLVAVIVAMDQSSAVVKIRPGLDGYRMTEFDLHPPSGAKLLLPVKTLLALEVVQLSKI